MDIVTVIFKSVFNFYNGYGFCNKVTVMYEHSHIGKITILTFCISSVDSVFERSSPISLTATTLLSNIKKPFKKTHIDFYFQKSL